VVEVGVLITGESCLHKTAMIVVEFMDGDGLHPQQLSQVLSAFLFGCVEKRRKGTVEYANPTIESQINLFQLKLSDSL
jgi:hypothetical protein